MKSCFIIVIVGLLVVCAMGGGGFWVLERIRVSDSAEKAAFAEMGKKLGSIPKSGTLMVVDFSNPSQSKRLRMIDLATRRTHFDARVAHGLNSGGIYATDFSNTPDSYQSSLGLFEIAEQFDGKHGSSFRLNGLDKEKNDKAFDRAIILHRADYVGIGTILLNWSEGFRLGRSLGCFVLTPQKYEQMEKKLVRPAYIYAHRK